MTVDVSALAVRVRLAAPRLGAVRLVCIDGPAGSGKTTLADRFVRELGAGAAVVHMDDLYEGWSGLGDVWPRVEAHILRPLGVGGPARYLRYDWREERFADWVDVPIPEVLVLEGCGSAPRAVDDRAVLRVFVTAPTAVRLARGLARDGEALRDRWLAWMDAEAGELGRERTRERADVVIVTAADPQGEAGPAEAPARA